MIKNTLWTIKKRIKLIEQIIKKDNSKQNKPPADPNKKRKIKKYLFIIQQNKRIQKQLDHLPKDIIVNWYNEFAKALYHFLDEKKLPEKEAEEAAARTAWKYAVPEKFKMRKNISKHP